MDTGQVLASAETFGTTETFRQKPAVFRRFGRGGRGDLVDRKLLHL